VRQLDAQSRRWRQRRCECRWGRRECQVRPENRKSLSPHKSRTRTCKGRASAEGGADKPQIRLHEVRQETRGHRRRRRRGLLRRGVDVADILGASTDKPTTPGKRTLACFAGRIPCAMHKADWLEVSRRTSYPKAIDTNEAAWGEYCKYSMLGYVRALTPQSVC
jgi:hypothetical protein